MFLLNFRNKEFSLNFTSLQGPPGSPGPPGASGTKGEKVSWDGMHRVDLETHLLILPWALSAGNIQAVGLIFISFVYNRSSYKFICFTFLTRLQSEMGVSQC